ncbi:MAG: LpxD N-terminal domain-containing protein, partial [Desulfobulbales bacterium]
MLKSHTLNELAALVDGKVIGNGNLRVTGLNGIELAGKDEITFLTDSKKVHKLAETRAAACIVPFEVEIPAMPCIQVANPDFAAAVILNHILARPFQAQGIHPSAHIGPDSRIQDEVSIGPLVCIGDRVQIGQRVTIYPGVVIGNDSKIGNDTVLYANVTIAERSIIGSRVIIHAGAA